jgi:hypothetical protein
MKQVVLTDVLVDSFNDLRENVTIFKHEQSLSGFQTRASRSLKKRSKQVNQMIDRDIKKVKKTINKSKKDLLKVTNKLEEMVTGKNIKAAPTSKRKTTTTTKKKSSVAKKSAAKGKKKVTKKA